MSHHPGVVFRLGPTGRRPGLPEGPDIWEVARVFKELDSQVDELIHQTANLTDLTPAQVRIAVRYYAEFQGEIDEWIRAVEQEAEEAEEAWMREQGILHR